MVPAEDVELIRAQLAEAVSAGRREAARELASWEERVHKVRRERFKWAEKAMAGVVPDDIARAKQDQLADQLAFAESEVERLAAAQASDDASLHAVLDLITDCGQAYQVMPGEMRREFNQAWFNPHRCRRGHCGWRPDRQRRKARSSAGHPRLAARRRHEQGRSSQWRPA